MPNLQHNLRKFDYGHLQIVANLWGIPLDAPDVRHAVPLLEAELKNNELLQEVVNALPQSAMQALAWLVSEGGTVTWAAFTRRCGEVREMGPGRRDREHPDQNPISPAEILWYRAFLARGFFDTETGPQEFAYVPNDLLELVSAIVPVPTNGEGTTSNVNIFLGRQATPEERQHVTKATAQIVDHTCTLLAGLRMGIDSSVHLPKSETATAFFRAILTTMGILGAEGNPNPKQTRAFLNLSRAETILALWQAWLSSSTHNDLRLTPSLQAEGAWENDPLRTRKEILKFLSRIPRNTWWSVSSFIARVKEKHPDFQRHSGDYDSWFLKDRGTGEYLRGFEHWSQVEGALLRYTIAGPLHWLGILDTATPNANAPVTAFRFSALSNALLDGKPPSTLGPETGQITIRSKGEIDIAASVPRAIRYQIARFCTWKPLKRERYYYSFTPVSLARAEEQGLQVAHLLTLLQGHAQAVPPNIIQALRRWRQQGVEASLKKETVLRLSSPAMLQALKKSRASRFLREQLGPAAVVIEEGAETKIAEALMEMGFLVRGAG
ncbi:MAG: hypothetical protein DRI56_05665 [Chloroflexota bacterium]|nr:MAG: hypothetical protein DRI56_05665 [Chloroflexota bacterium]